MTSKSLLDNLSKTETTIEESRKKRNHVKKALIRGFIDDVNDSDLGSIL